VNNKGKIIIGALALAFLIGGGALLPQELALGRDNLILGQVQSQPLDPFELAAHVDVSIIDKIILSSDIGGTSIVPLATGAIHDHESIEAKFLDELETLIRLRFFPELYEGALAEEETTFVVSANANLHIQNDAPAINMILWEVNFRAQTISGNFLLDDRTGKILSFNFSGTGYGYLVYREHMVNNWAAYLGTGVRNITQVDGQARYTFELYSGTRSVSGQIASVIQGVGSRANRWYINYPSAF